MIHFSVNRRRMSCVMEARFFFFFWGGAFFLSQVCVSKRDFFSFLFPIVVSTAVICVCFSSGTNVMIFVFFFSHTRSFSVRVSFRPMYNLGTRRVGFIFRRTTSWFVARF